MNSFLSRWFRKIIQDEHQYRIIHMDRTLPWGGWFAISGVNFDQEGKVSSWFGQPEPLYTGSVDGLRAMMNEMRRAFDREILSERDLAHHQFPWVRIEDFEGSPNSDPLLWWWDEAPKGSPELDEGLLDEGGKICGKGGCGLDFYSHVMLVEFRRPVPPNQLNNTRGV